MLVVLLRIGWFGTGAFCVSTARRLFTMTAMEISLFVIVVAEWVAEAVVG